LLELRRTHPELHDAASLLLGLPRTSDVKRLRWAPAVLAAVDGDVRADRRVGQLKQRREHLVLARPDLLAVERRGFGQAPDEHPEPPNREVLELGLKVEAVFGKKRSLEEFPVVD
jgi:hypothetical protein